MTKIALSGHAKYSREAIERSKSDVTDIIRAVWEEMFPRLPWEDVNMSSSDSLCEPLATESHDMTHALYIDDNEDETSVSIETVSNCSDYMLHPSCRSDPEKAATRETCSDPEKAATRETVSSQKRGNAGTPCEAGEICPSVFGTPVVPSVPVSVFRPLFVPSVSEKLCNASRSHVMEIKKLHKVP